MPALVVWILLALLVILALNAWLVRRETRPASPRDGGSIIVTDIVPANVRVDGDGPPIVMIHGLLAAINCWDAVVPALALHRRVIRLDLIGHGGTEAPRTGYSIQRHAALVAAVLRQLGVAKATIIGHSIGGQVLLAFAEAHPEMVDRLVIMDTPPTADISGGLAAAAFDAPLLGEAIYRALGRGTLSLAVRIGRAMGIAARRTFIADARRLTYMALRESHRSGAAFRRAIPSHERLARLPNHPRALVIVGSEDRIVPQKFARLYAAAPRTRVETIAGVGHSTMIEAPERTVSLIESFLAEQD